MKRLTAALFLCTLALSACTGLAENHRSASPFPASTDQGMG